MDALYRRMPVDRLRVPAADFAAVLNATAARFAADRSDRFAAGALACAQWIAGITDAHPIRDGREPCTMQGMESCQMMADAVVYGMPHAPTGIDQRWALGVAGMVSWARGAARRPPVNVNPRRVA
ncbi:hypothetical protein [Micromonospora aurantiaca (nom. illeg.)]|uniref:hypothetical protein n=1 Tax=Micromonospora aurantiaca (nom. illeg.) TaxID=47850 RepID=UPI000828A1F5|nr:hypothetical protein [Micromonospora aurantiaca]SCL21191.1 hypothetical protein GA0070615_0016 [Micromonospora aurantiaca]